MAHLLKRTGPPALSYARIVAMCTSIPLQKTDPLPISVVLVRVFQYIGLVVLALTRLIDLTKKLPKRQPSQHIVHCVVFVTKTDRGREAPCLQLPWMPGPATWRLSSKGTLGLTSISFQAETSLCSPAFSPDLHGGHPW